MGRGIDYGYGTTNIDKETGIRFGVINQNAVLQAWADSSEADYGEPHCPKCGNEAVAGDSDISQEVIDEYNDEHRIDAVYPSDEVFVASVEDSSRDDLGWEYSHGSLGDYACDDCRYLFDADQAFGDEANGYYVGVDDDNGKLIPDSDGYLATSYDSQGDIFILKSPYYTRAAFCSPCAPGACYLKSPDSDGDKAYCFGVDWFDSEFPCPYPIYRVDNDELVYTPEVKE